MKKLLFCFNLIAILSFSISAHEKLSHTVQIGRIYYTDGYRNYPCEGIADCFSTYRSSTFMMGYRADMPLNKRWFLNVNFDFHVPHQKIARTEFKTHEPYPVDDPNDPDYDIDKLIMHRHSISPFITDRIVGAKVTSHAKWYFKSNHEERKIKGYILAGAGFAYHHINSQITDDFLTSYLNDFNNTDLGPWDNEEFAVLEGIFAPSLNMGMGHELRCKDYGTFFLEFLLLSNAHNKRNSKMGLIRTATYQLTAGYRFL